VVGCGSGAFPLVLFPMLRAGSHIGSGSVTFPPVLFLMLRVGSHIRDLPPVVGSGNGRFWCILFDYLGLRRVGRAE
jgi:hypothetical protein